MTKPAAIQKDLAEDRACAAPPPFTLGDLKRAIPAHCFERNTWTSLRYIAQDMAGAAVLYYLSTFIDQPGVPTWARFVLWPLYWWCQGVVLTGLWVIAHECGHRAFSPNETFGDFIGMMLHSMLLVPYHPWRISHAKHHARTNHIDEDEVFIPERKSQVGDMTPYEDMPGIVSFAQRVFEMGRMLVFGWPTYLLMHVTGRDYGRHTDHFSPYSPLFSEKERVQVILSDIVLFSWVGALFLAGHAYGLAWLTKVYLVPYLWVNFWLVLITFLQHTDTRVPHFSSREWTWLRGALCTVDRDYGVLNHFHHHIADTHVVHHLFSRMPHYHAEEATRAVKPLLGKYYVEPNVAPGLLGIVQSLWSAFTYCRAVDDSKDVMWFLDR
ncbi:delta-12 fatty acid desaturase [Salpingoeca rosetta]|uniref:Delta-12 fatty acid desaturase n=1 Tax=Salpingoeca rosetta (strain ATCC 50818 / BSB-021) TaxID=946362 RepID=F2UI59_SALR5|nr:delta-12 fatty acid desaturase [Salpingoeca rosetta]EGD76808.1 delta-12 fatty acid desaturase [Salpingoeca rosetta]|eukprot:XP_004991180.1 delta-12 fatty acid desaturase [Salpingoeca rosetta]